MILVTFAVADESRDFARAVARENLPARILITGMGEQRCRAALREYLEREPRPEMVISSGFAGALDPTLQVGDMVWARNFTTAQIADLPYRNGAMTTQPTLIASADEKAALFRQVGAIAVDMETAHLAAECAARNLSLLAVRVISDAAGQSMPVPHAVWFDEATQKPRPIALVLWLLAHPMAIPAFVRFVRGIFTAQKNLAQELTRVLKTVASSSPTP